MGAFIGSGVSQAFGEAIKTTGGQFAASVLGGGITAEVLGGDFASGAIGGAIGFGLSQLRGAGSQAAEVDEQNGSSGVGKDNVILSDEQIDYIVAKAHADFAGPTSGTMVRYRSLPGSTIGSHRGNPEGASLIKIDVPKLSTGYSTQIDANLLYETTTHELIHARNFKLTGNGMLFGNNVQHNNGAYDWIYKEANYFARKANIDWTKRF